MFIKISFTSISQYLMKKEMDKFALEQVSSSLLSAAKNAFNLIFHVDQLILTDN